MLQRAHYYMLNLQRDVLKSAATQEAMPMQPPLLHREAHMVVLFRYPKNNGEEEMVSNVRELTC